MTTDYRALLAVVAEQLDTARDPDDLGIRADRMVAQIREALAQPAPQGPTDGAIDKLATGFRAELQRLVKAYDDHGGRWPQHHEDALQEAVERARAELAKPEPEGPTDEEIADTFAQGCREGAGNPDQPPFLAGARAVLARWGRAAAPPETADFDPRLITFATTSEQIPPGPYSEHELRTQWNAQADEFNQWESLDLSEQLAWAQARAIAADRARAALAQPEPVGRPWPVPGDAEGLAEVFWGNYDQFGALGKHDPRQASSA